MRRQKDLIIAIALVAMILALSLGCASRQAKVMEPQPTTEPVVNADTLDSDGDGVLDRRDMCPSTRVGDAVDASGCTIRDDNHNGIPDNKEALWKSVYGSGSGVGYPNKEPLSSGPQCTMKIGGVDYFVIHFAKDEAQLDPSANFEVNKIRDVYLENPCRMELNAYASFEGAPDYNLALSSKRGEMVKQRLVSYGIPADSISVVAHGGTMKRGQPADNRVVVYTPK
ncbi:OmpA family protein [Patescibacteria group bacterium]|nr:OmpA family protein [Patescibacteria group bacterium]